MHKHGATAFQILSVLGDVTRLGRAVADPSGQEAVSRLAQAAGSLSVLAEVNPLPPAVDYRLDPAAVLRSTGIAREV